MTPLEFVTRSGNQYNDPVGEVLEALDKPLVINTANDEWEVLSYYYCNTKRCMMLDIQKVKKVKKPKKRGC